MRIGIFSDSYKPYTSGVVTSISTIKEELINRGHEVFVFAPSYPHYSKSEDGIYRFYSFPCPTNHDFTLAIPLFPGINILLKQLKLDLIHVHSPFTLGRVGMHYAQKFKLPLIFTYHTMYELYTHYIPVVHDLAKDITVKYSNSFCNDCDHIIAPSQEVKNLLTNYDIQTPISVIPTGVPLDKFKSGEGDWLIKNFNIPSNHKILLYVGRLVKEKNLEFLIQAFKLVHEKIPETTLVLTAQGPWEIILKNEVSTLGMSVGRDVVFTGAMPLESLINIYHSADLFLFSSLTETQGLVIVEAMAAGLPVVAVKANGVQDMIENGVEGLLTACDIREFSEAVCKVLNNKEIYDYFKENALKKAHELSSIRMATMLEAVYYDLCQKNSYRPDKLTDRRSRFIVR